MDDHALRGQAIEYRVFDLAGDTPGCHVDQCGFALEICVGDQALLIFHRGQRERGQRLADQRRRQLGRIEKKPR